MDSARLILQQPCATARSLQIAVVTETYPPEVNGVAMTIGRMIAGLRHRGHRIQLIRPRQHRNDFAVQRLDFEEVLVRGVAIPRYDMLKLGLPAKRKLRRLWSERRPDIVHLVTEGPLGWSALVAAQGLDVPVSSDFHTNFHTYSQHYGVGWFERPIAAYLRWFHNKTLCTMVPTEDMRRDLERIGLVNLRVVARGVDATMFHPGKRSGALRESWGASGGELVAVCVGRLAPEKNLPLVLETYAAMRQANPRLRLVLVGDGPDRAALQARHPECVFAGMRTGEDLVMHYASGDIFLFPSTTETYGNVTIEAMASGLAVVAYDYAAAARHIRHGSSGLVAKFDDAGDFVRLAVGLADDRERVRRLGQSARAAAERLDWKWILADFEAALLELSADGAPDAAHAGLSA